MTFTITVYSDATRKVSNYDYKTAKNPLTSRNILQQSIHPIADNLRSLTVFQIKRKVMQYNGAWVRLHGGKNSWY